LRRFHVNLTAAKHGIPSGAVRVWTQTAPLLQRVSADPGNLTILVRSCT